MFFDLIKYVLQSGVERMFGLNKFDLIGEVELV